MSSRGQLEALSKSVYDAIDKHSSVEEQERIYAQLYATLLSFIEGPLENLARRTDLRIRNPVEGDPKKFNYVL